MAESKTDHVAATSSTRADDALTESNTTTDTTTMTEVSSSTSNAKEEASSNAQSTEEDLLENAKKQFTDMMSSLNNNNRLLRQFISYMQTEIKVIKKTLGSKRKEAKNLRPKESKRKKNSEPDDGDSSEYMNGTEETPTRTTKRARKPTSYVTKMANEDDEEADDETFGKPTKRSKAKKKSKKTYTDDPRTLLYSTDSVLCDVELRDVINFQNFDTLLTAEEKDKLLDDLAPADRKSLDAIKDFFKSSELSADFERYKELLEVGAFDKNGLKKKRKERPLDPWKVKYFEEYWGQKKDGLQIVSDKKNAEEKAEEELFSFVKYEKDHPRPERKSTATNSTMATTTTATTTAEEDHQIMKRLKKKRRRSNSDEKKEKRVGLSRRRKNKPGMRVLTEEEEKRKERRASLGFENGNDDFEIEDLDSDEASSASSAPTTPKSKAKEKKPKKDKHSFRDGAFTILKRENRPLSAQEIARIGLSEGFFNTSGKTPHNTLAALLYCDIKKNKDTPFKKVKAMTFGLREWGDT